MGSCSSGARRHTPYQPLVNWPCANTGGRMKDRVSHMAACTYNQSIKYVHEFRWYETHRIHKLHIFRSCWKGVYLFSLYCGEGACYSLSDLFHLRKHLSRLNTFAGARLIEPIKTHLGLPQKIQNRVLTNISRGNSVKPGYLFKSTQNFSFNSLALWHHHYVRCVCMCVCMNIKNCTKNKLKPCYIFKHIWKM